MKTIKYGIFRNVVNVYESTKELPMSQYIEHQKNIAIHSGIGSSAEDYLRRVNQAITYINNDNKKEAIKELQNQYKLMHFMLNGQSPIFEAFVCLVKDINGKAVVHTEKGIKEAKKKLKSIPFETLFSTVEEVKKKSILNLFNFSKKTK